jgi:hypothetical protein
MATRRDYRDPWPVRWSAVWVGALTGIAMALLLGLLAVALGAYGGGRLGPEDLGLGDLIAAVGGAFFSFVAGGWVAARLGGWRYAEPAALHGAIAWLVALPLLIMLIALGAGSLFGAWWTGLAGAPAWATPRATAAAAELAQEAAGGALTALLLGLVGSVLGGWLGSGAPMTIDQPLRGRPQRASQTA